MKRYLIAIVCCLALTTTKVRADSPLTSTDFNRAYQDVALVKKAGTSGMDESIMAALSNPNVPHDVRAAIVNALGWNIDGQQNGRMYAEYVARSHNVTTSELTIDMLTPQEAFALGYLLAMDDYFTMKPLGGTGEVEQARPLELLDAAVGKNHRDFSIYLIRSLVRTQNEMHRLTWCGVYTDISSAISGFPFERNMRDEAVGVIMEYMNIYQEYCGDKSPN
ncbi:hypothetical protein [[Phormidium] sp. ETS-05]|uniref:hypothetical protein n=1 Tax=[Phormidium] sp. ETS-05 TaxID=222819 RepID=UPI0018EEFFD1|nr:hypothetical protein [[Phormidium] sp. ETS-05]